MKLIVGLGNIGSEFDNTYHNMGFLTIDKFAKDNGFEFTKNKCDAIVAEGRIDNEKVVLAKPTTYMNLSGKAIKELLKKNGGQISDLLVLVDDIDLPAGKFRYRTHGSAGTHNGLRSCVAELASEEFARLRIGVGKPENGEDLANYVLSKIPADKLLLISTAISESQSTILDFIKQVKK